MKNPKVKKRILICAAVLLVVLLAVDIAGANYLVSFAIGRTTSGGVAVVPKAATTTETRNTVNENWKRIREHTQQWLSQVELETVSIQSSDGLRLEGDLCVTDAASSKWAILVHGYSASRAMMADYAVMFAEHGYNVLAPDLRGHGGSDGDYIGMGWPDRLDMLLWIGELIRRDPQAEIVLFGVSMGGATVTMTSGEALPENVKAIVEDCGYTSVWDIFSDEMDVLFHLPTFPLLHTASAIGKIRAGYHFTEASSLEQVKKATVPMLFLHGAVDNFVHTEMVYQLYDACSAPKDIQVFENAGHGQSFQYAPEEYEAKVFAFLENYV